MVYRQLYEDIHNEYSFEKKLKSSPKGSIYLVRNKNTGERSVYRHFYGSEDVYQKLLGVTCENLPQIKYTSEENGRVLVIEEYIQGDGLDFILEGGSLTVEQARDIAIQVCRALKVLHSVGAVHRDVKPDNIILRGDKAVLIDFDASRMYKEEQSSDTRVMGTTGYAAPEQYGFSQTDARADVYAVGVLINEMLTNRHPATFLAEGVLRPIIEKCIEVNVDKRYSSADELLIALEALSDENMAAALALKKRIAFAKKLLGVIAVTTVMAMGIFVGRMRAPESSAAAAKDIEPSTESVSEITIPPVGNPESVVTLPEPPYGRMNFRRVYRNSDNGIVEMSSDGTGGFYWTVDESDLTKPVINFVYAGSATNREDIMKELGYSEESENFPITVELDYAEGYENVVHGVDEGETDTIMRVCSVRNGILEEGVNDFWFEWYDSDGVLPTFRQTITLNIDYGSGFDVATLFDSDNLKDTPGTLNIQTVYRSTTDGDINLAIDKFDYRIGYATDSSGSITDVKVTYAYTGPSLSAAEMKEHLHFFDDETSRIIMRLTPPNGYNGMKRNDGTQDGFFHAVVAQNGKPHEDKRTYIVTWTDSTGELPDLTQKIVFAVDYGGRISAVPTGYAPTITTVETLPEWAGKLNLGEIYRETSNGNISLENDVFDIVVDDSDVFDVPITFVYKGRSKRIDELAEEMELTDPNTVITVKLRAPKGYNGYTRLDGKEDLYFRTTIARDEELIEEERVYTITWQDSTGSLPSFKQKIRIKADFGNLV